MKAIAPIDLKFELQKLIFDFQNIAKACSFFESKDQISLRHSHRQPVDDNQILFQDGIGSLYDYQARRWLAHESDFKFNHPTLIGTYLEEAFSKVAEISPVPLGRFRIMRLKQKSCYSWHKDLEEYRYHIPLITNPACFFISESGGLERLAEPGRLYLVRTKDFHTAVNASLEDRIHLVISTCEAK